MRVLLIEDNRDMAHTTRMLLENYGWSSDVTGSLEEAFQVTDPDAILLDLNIRDSCGVETLDAVANHFEAPIVVLTGRSDVQGLVGERMAVAVLLKTAADGAMIDRTLRAAVGKRRKIAELDRLKRDITTAQRKIDAIDRHLPNGFHCEDCRHFDQCSADGSARRGQAQCEAASRRFLPVLLAAV